MRSLLIAAALGLGLLSASAGAQMATASPFSAVVPTGIGDEAPAISPVHYQRGYHRHDLGRAHYVPPRRHWRAYVPPHRHYPRYHRPYQHGRFH